MSGELIFYPETHTYFLDGKEIPSVTTVLRFLSQEVYANISPQVLERAALRGTRIHEATEVFDKTGEMPDGIIDGDIYGYLKAYAAFCADYKPVWMEIETKLTDGEVAGTVDRIGSVEGISQPVTVDIKSSSKIHLLSVSAQTTKYSDIYEDSTEIWTLPYYLHLKPTGEYVFAPCDPDLGWQVWAACYTLHKALKENE